MMCDGSGELKWGYLCRGCDACNGLLPPPRVYPARSGEPPLVLIDMGCPWCQDKPRCACAPVAVAS